MCGHAGVAGYVTNRELDAFKDLLYVTSLRGPHSTGVYTASFGNYQKDAIVKRPLSSPDFIYETSYGKKAILSYPSRDIYMGHCRYATVGDITAENAHPFEFPDFIGAHNGHIETYAPKRPVISNIHTNRKIKTKTDSQIFFEEVSKKGLEETLKTLDYHDAYACVMYMKNEKKIKMFRNNKRPLFFSYNPDTRVLFWASELEMINLVTARNNLNGYKNFVVNPFNVITFDCRAIMRGEEVPYESFKYEEPKVPVSSTIIYRSPKATDMKVVVDNTKTSDLSPEVSDELPWHDNIAFGYNE